MSKISFATETWRTNHSKLKDTRTLNKNKDKRHMHTKQIQVVKDKVVSTFPFCFLIQNIFYESSIWYLETNTKHA